MMSALFIGRFQPFHNGHLAIIRNILETHKSITIIIGSTQEKNTSVNPFSADERKAMMELALNSEKTVNSKTISYSSKTISFSSKKTPDKIPDKTPDKTSDYEIVYVPDINDFGAWVEHLKKRLSLAGLESKDIVVYTGSGITKRLFEDEGDKVIWIKERLGNISSSEIRLRIAKGMEWQHLVPKAVSSYIKGIKGDERIRHLLKMRKAGKKKPMKMVYI